MPSRCTANAAASKAARPPARLVAGSVIRPGGMGGLCAFVGATVGSGVGWWLGTPGGLMWEYLLSVVGTAVGVWLGRRFAARYFD